MTSFFRKLVGGGSKSQEADEESFIILEFPGGCGRVVGYPVSRLIFGSKSVVA